MALLQNQVRNLLVSQVQAVLATVSPGPQYAPHLALMAYGFCPTLTQVYLATHGQARKAQHMLAPPGLVRILWDNRTGNLRDHQHGMLVTASGRASRPEDEHESKRLFLERNPNMGVLLFPT